MVHSWVLWAILVNYQTSYPHIVEISEFVAGSVAGIWSQGSIVGSHDLEPVESDTNSEWLASN